jgi:hypothetical protein
MRLWRALVLIVAVGSTLATGVATGSVQRLIHYKVAAPITVQALGVDLSQPQVGQAVTAGAKLVAERPTTVRYLVIVVRDQAGANYDFPRAENFRIGTRQKVFTAQRTFDKPGIYTYWVGYLKDGKWTNLSPRGTITVQGTSGSTPTPTPTPTPSPTAPSPSPTPSPTPTQTSTSAPAPPSGAFPSASNTGVPAGVALSTYTGPCTITTSGTVIDGKTVNCDLSIRAQGVVIKNTKVNGAISTADGSQYSFTLTDSTVDANPGGIRLVTAIGADNFTLLRTEVMGGNRAVYCRRNCEVRDSWIHGIEVLDTWHASGIRASQGSRIIHNTITCDAQPTPQDGGCSANLTMYGDFEAVQDVRVEGNLFLANNGAAFCSYGGSSQGKPYSSGAANIVFTNNVFQRGTSRKCAAYGPITSFDSSRPGNQWTNNKYDDGAIVPPEN